MPWKYFTIVCLVNNRIVGTAFCYTVEWRLVTWLPPKNTIWNKHLMMLLMMLSPWAVHPLPKTGPKYNEECQEHKAFLTAPAREQIVERRAEQLTGQLLASTEGSDAASLIFMSPDAKPHWNWWNSNQWHEQALSQVHGVVPHSLSNSIKINRIA